MNKLKNVFLVGGAVRDELMGVNSHDRDYVVVGETAENMLAMGFQSVGADFPVFLHPQTKDEYALARTERKSGNGYKGFKVDASADVTLEEDLARRDLTINAMAMNDQGEVIDPFNGQQDLKDKVLRHTTIAFAEDPVRVLRIARFRARYGSEWTIHQDTLNLMLQVKNEGELQSLVAERVWKETEKALGERYPELFFETLLGFGIFPEIEAMVDIPQPPKHHPEGDVFVHTMLALRRSADLQHGIETRFAVLTHDFGKAFCHLQNGNLHGHEHEGVAIIKGFCEKWRVPTKYKQLACLTSDNHTRCHKLFELQPKKLHKLIVENMDALAHPERFQQFLQACVCDAQGRGETMVNRPYPQAEFAKLLFDALNHFDKKVVVKRALEQGKQGPEIGMAIREAEIACIRTFLSASKSHIDSLKSQ